ncbi:hypothetical protein B9479_008182 [Cryptococcus floricola]|uniref:Uncharacterized protein n=1 Tax=Cryptococcus floricola TaxID=2591691 RepID=A0A5D3AMN7_9TREE|nr:hypothetical protein B9479_008182 [Cryptococcus floricola]
MSDFEDLHIPAGVLANALFSLPNPDETDDLEEEGISHESADIEPRGATPDGYTFQGVSAPDGESRIGDFVASQSMKSTRLTRRIKAEIEDMLADFRGKLVEYAVSKGLRSSTVQEYAWRHQTIPNNWDLFQASDIGKGYTEEYQAEHANASQSQAYQVFKEEKVMNFNTFEGSDVGKAYVAEYQAQHPNTTLQQAYEAFKKEKVKEMRNVLADSYGASQVMKLSGGQTTNNVDQRARIIDQITKSNQALFRSLERSYGLSFVLICTTSHRQDDFGTTVITPNASDALDSIKKDYLLNMALDLGVVLKGDRIKAWTRANMPSASLPPVVTSEYRNLSLKDKKEMLKAFLQKSFTGALREVSPGSSPKEDGNLQFLEERLKKRGIRLSVDPEINREELARGGRNHEELDKYLEAVKEGKIFFHALPPSERPVQPPRKKRRHAAIASVSSELRAPFGAEDETDVRLRQQNQIEGDGSAGASVAGTASE